VEKYKGIKSWGADQAKHLYLLVNVLKIGILGANGAFLWQGARLG
jgi:hypothetical protein